MFEILQKRFPFTQVNVDTCSQEEVQGVVLEDDKGLSEPQDLTRGEDVERLLSQPQRNTG